jgi:hypothetical protein
MDKPFNKALLVVFDVAKRPRGQEARRPGGQQVLR